jgi:hypothetical protein
MRLTPFNAILTPFYAIQRHFNAILRHSTPFLLPISPAGGTQIDFTDQMSLPKHDKMRLFGDMGQASQAVCEFEFNEVGFALKLRIPYKVPTHSTLSEQRCESSLACLPFSLVALVLKNALFLTKPAFPSI